jgi:ADP-ribosylglycohydrolase
LESESYEDAVRNAISLGGDSDTLGSIAGAIAEALHGIPEDIQEEAESRYLAKAPDIIELIREMYRTVGN